MDCKNSARNYDMATKLFKIKELLEFQKKSRRKAGEGLEVGQYPFFTSSQIQKKWCDEADYHDESIVLGTGGGPSVHYSKDFSTSTDVFILTPSIENVSAKYIAYFLTENRKVLERGFKGAGLKHISRDYVENIEIAVPVDRAGNPDIKEQDRVVHLLEEAEILKRKRAEADQKMEEVIPALFSKMFGDPDSNPMGWPTVSLSELGTLDRGKSQHRPRTDESLFGGPYPFVQTGDVTNAGWRIQNHHQTYSEKGLNQSKLWPKETLCITVAANIARTTILDFEACFPDSVVGFIPNKNTNADYVQALFMFLQKRLEEQAPRAAQLNINLAILRSLRVPAPPNKLQDEFSERVKELLSIKEKQKRSMETISALFSSLLAKSL